MSRHRPKRGAPMTFTEKCKLLDVRRGRRLVLAVTDNKLRAALLPRQ